MQVMTAFYIHSSGKDNKISLLYTFSGGKNRLFSNFFLFTPISGPYETIRHPETGTPNRRTRVLVIQI